jgi:hypothetical protein
LKVMKRAQELDPSVPRLSAHTAAPVTQGADRELATVHQDSAAVLRLQRSAGNDAVAALLDRRPTTQLTAQRDDDGSAAAPATDPAAAGEDPTVADLEAAFDPDQIISAMEASGAGAADLAPEPAGSDPAGNDPAGGGGAPPTAQALSLQRDPPPGPPPGGPPPQPADPTAPPGAPQTKPGSPGDILAALAATPEFKALLDKLLASLKAAFPQIAKGLAPPTASASGPVSPAASKGLPPTAGGIPLPIPGVDGISVLPKMDGGKPSGVTVNVDLLKLIPKLRKVPGFN